MAIVVGIGIEVLDWFGYGRKLGLIKFLPMTLGDLLADGLGILFACIGGYNG